MNLFLAIIVGTIIFEYVLSFVSRQLNLKSLTTNLPDQFVGFYDEKKYAKSQNYTRANSSFGRISSTFNFILILAVIFLGLFDTLDQYARSFGYSPLITGLIFFGIITIIQDILSTPFSLYSTFIIEEEYGFNKSTAKIYVMDKLKSYLLLLLLGIPLISAILYFFESLENAWLYAWGLMALLSVVMPKIYTQFIAPMFNKFTPLEDGELRDLIENYSKEVDFPLTEVYVIDGSKRSAHSNAYFTGFGKNKRIVLFDTLMEDHTNEEILAILAHEVGHYKKKHIIKGMFTSIIHSGIMLYILGLFIKMPELHTAMGMSAEQPSVYAGLIFFSLLYAPIELVLSIMFNMLSRKHEFEADEYSAQTLKNTSHMISGLKNLTVKNLGNLTPHPLPVFLSYSHPPVLDRISALERIKFS
jgi:STE24 endopeptidase